MIRLQRALFGDRSGRATSSIAAASRVPGTMTMLPPPGPFDEPPAEAITLDAELLPWELQTDDERTPGT